MKRHFEIGQRHHRLEVIGIPKGGVFLDVRCDCGTVKQVRRGDFVRGNLRSCGCLRHENKGCQVSNSPHIDVPLSECPVWRKLAGEPDPRHAVTTLERYARSEGEWT